MKDTDRLGIVSYDRVYDDLHLKVWTKEGSLKLMQLLTN